MERAKNAGLVLCLFVVLLVIFSSYFRANAAGAFFGALAGTPLLVHVLNRLAPRRQTRASERSAAAITADAELIPHATEQVVVLRVERPNGA